jgi:hypothetical protein
MMELIIELSQSGPEVKLTYIQVADTCFEGDDRSYRHVGNLILNRDPITDYTVLTELAPSGR